MGVDAVRMFRFTIVTFGTYLVVRFLEKYLEFKLFILLMLFAGVFFIFFTFIKWEGNFIN